MNSSAFLRSGVTILTLTSFASAAIYNLNPTADAFLTGGSSDPAAGSPAGNYGGAGALMVSPSNATKGEIQTLLKFNLAGAKASFDSTYGVGNWMVDSITLKLGTNNGTANTQPNNNIFNQITGGVFKLDWLATDTWTEGTGSPSAPTTDGVTFNSLVSLKSAADRTVGTFTYTPVGNTSTTSSGTQPATYTLSLDPDFLADVKGGNFVSLRAYAGDTSVGYLFNSRSQGPAADPNATTPYPLQPLLTISASAVPEPGTGAYVAVAALALALQRRRHARTA